MNCQHHNQEIKYFCAAEACYYLPLCDQCCNQHKQAHNKLETIPLKKAYLIAESNIRRQETEIQRLIAPFKTREFMAKEISKQKEGLEREKQRLIQIVTEKIDAEIRLLENSNQTELSREETNLKKSLQLKSQQIGTFGCPHFYKKSSVLRKALNYEMTYFLEEMVSKNNQNLMKVHHALNNSNRFRVFQNIHHEILISPLELREKAQEKTRQVKRIMNESPLYFLIDENMATSSFLYSLLPDSRKVHTYNIDQETWTTSHTSLEILRQGTAVHDQLNNRLFWIGGVGGGGNPRQSINNGGWGGGRQGSGNYDSSSQRSNRILVFEPNNKENQWRYLSCTLNIPRSSCHAVIVQEKNYPKNYGIVIAGGIGQNGEVLKSTEYLDLENERVTLLHQTNFGAFSGTLVAFNSSNVLRIGGLYKNKTDYSIVEVVQRLDCTQWLENKAQLPKWSYVQLLVPHFDRTQTPNLFHANQAAIQINPNEIFVFGGMSSDQKGTVDSYIIGVEEFNVQSRGMQLNSRLGGEQRRKDNLVKQMKFTVRWVNEKPLITGDDFGGQSGSMWKGKLHILQNMSSNEITPYQKRLLEFNMHEWSEIEQVLPE